jgi:glucuronokinase
MVGLSGSSAIIIATFKVLMKFYNLTLENMKIAKEQFPQLILDIEKQELDIAAGLQDRVIQTYGGEAICHMTANPLVLQMAVKPTSWL